MGSGSDRDRLVATWYGFVVINRDRHVVRLTFENERGRAGVLIVFLIFDQLFQDGGMWHIFCRRGHTYVSIGLPRHKALALQFIKAAKLHPADVSFLNQNHGLDEITWAWLVK